LRDQVGGLRERNGRDMVEVRRDAMDADRAAEDRADPLLEHRPAALESILEERLVLRKAERDDRPVEADRAAGGDQRLDGRALAEGRHDRRPGGAKLVDPLRTRWVDRWRL